MEAANADRDAARTQRSCDIERAGKLVRLHAHQHDHAGTRILDQLGEPLGPDLRVGFVDAHGCRC